MSQPENMQQAAMTDLIQQLQDIAEQMQAIESERSATLKRVAELERQNEFLSQQVATLGPAAQRWKMLYERLQKSVGAAK